MFVLWNDAIFILDISKTLQLRYGLRKVVRVYSYIFRLRIFNTNEVEVGIVRLIRSAAFGLVT